MNKLPVLNDLFSRYSVIFIPKHFITKFSVNLLKLKGASSLCVPAKIFSRKGRPSGGLAFFFISLFQF